MLEQIFTTVRTAITLRTTAMVSVGLLIGVFLSSSTVSAQLTNTSPNPSDMTASGTRGGISHLLKKESVAHVLKLRLGAYYPRNTQGNTSGEKLEIRYGIMGKKCIIDNIGGHFGNDNAFVRVTITGKGTTNKIYKIPISQVCADIGQTRNNVAEGESGNWKDNRFFANYAYPQQLGFDASTGKYKSNITIEYSSGVNQGGSDTNSVNFLVHTSSTNAKLGPLGNSESQEFGLRSAYFREGQKKNVQASQQFGIPCDGNTINRMVRLYDPDINVFGNTYLWITKNNVKLRVNEYNVGLSGRVTWDESNKRFKSTGAQSGQESRLVIRQVVPGATYRFVIMNEITPRKASPNSNVLSISIPEDSIYGDTVNCNYNLVPEVKTINPAMYSSYPNINVRSAIDQTIDGGAVGSEHVWRTYAVRYEGEPNKNTAGDEVFDGDPCEHRIPTGWTTCDIPMNTSYPAASDSVDSFYNSGGPDGPNTRLCFVSVVKKPRNNSPDNQWRYSDMKCARTAKKPTVQFRGSDLKVNGMIRTSITEAKDEDDQPLKTFGSWVEYGVFSTGTNQTASSGAGLRNGSTSSKTIWSQLTFANATNLANPDYGNYTPLPTSSSAESYFTGLPGTSGLNPTASGVYDVGDITIGGNVSIPEAAKGRSLIIRSSGTVTINGSIEVNNDRRSSIRDISQIVILAKHINIQRSAGRVDAWLLAREGGSIDTCSDVNIPLTADSCPQPLEVNGAISMSNGSKLYLKRTGGADESGFATSAEVFRLRPDVQLWAFNYSSETEHAQTVYMTELPPRF